MPEILTEVRGRVGFITLNRPKALNALSLGMIRALTAALRNWRDDTRISAVAMRGMNRGPAGGEPVPFGAFCAGGDIRFFHRAAIEGDPALEDFFTEEYALNHLIHVYPKPCIAFMDGVVMGGGMGLAQGAQLRVATEHTRMAMPETQIGLFPDVGGGHFLSRCPGHLGEYLGLSGRTLDAGGALQAGLADLAVPAGALPALWQALGDPDLDGAAVQARVQAAAVPPDGAERLALAAIDAVFGLRTVSDMLAALEAPVGLDPSWAAETAALLRKRSPLMLHVVLEQIRRARHMGLADDLRMERDLVRHCFRTAHLGRFGVESETVEGVRALAVDKDHRPRWNPARIEAVTPAIVEPFFHSPWPVWAHPLRDLD